MASPLIVVEEIENIIGVDCGRSMSTSCSGSSLEGSIKPWSGLRSFNFFHPLIIILPASKTAMYGF